VVVKVTRGFESHPRREAERQALDGLMKEIGDLDRTGT
jgi:hypothetical protein